MRLFRRFISTGYIFAVLCFFSYCLYTSYTSGNFFYGLLGLIIILAGLMSAIEAYLLETRNVMPSGSKARKNSDVIIFVSDQDLESVKISAIASKHLKGANRTSIVDLHIREEVRLLCNELNVNYVTSMTEIDINSEFVLLANASMAMYPDALNVSRRQFNDEVDVVELNFSKKAAGVNKARSSGDVSSHSALSTALSSHNIFMYNGGAVIARAEVLRESLGDGSSFEGIIANFLSRKVKGAITAHSCFEPISVNETTSSLEMRALRYRVYLLIKKASSIKRNFREKVASLYRKLMFLKNGALIVTCITVPAYLTFTPKIKLNFSIIMAIVGIAIFDKLMKTIYRDKRTYKEIILEAFIELEAYLKTTTSVLKYLRRTEKYKLRFPVFFVTYLYVCLLISAFNYIGFIEVAERDKTLFSIIALLLAASIIYRATIVYFSAQQRSFVRRKVSIPGSLDSESIWIVDLTHRGAGFISDTRLEIGEEAPLVFRVPSQQGDEVITVIGKVTYCGTRKDQYQVGVQFKELSFEAQDKLMYFTTVLYPYQLARKITDASIIPQEIMTKFRYGMSRDPLTLAMNVFTALLVALVVVSNIAVLEKEETIGTVAAISTNTDLVNKEILIEKNSSQIAKAQSLAEISNETPRIKVTHSFIESPQNGYKPSEVIRVRTTVSNTSTVRADKGLKVRTVLPRDVKLSSFKLISSDGFMPCGLNERVVTCTTTRALLAKSELSFDFEIQSLVRANSTTTTRLVRSNAELNQADIKNYALDFNSAHSAYDSVIPAYNPASVSGKVSLNNDSGLEGIKVELLRFDDKNRNGRFDYGEATSVSIDTSDQYGYFGAAKGNSAFLNLDKSKQYSLQFSLIPKGLNNDSSYERVDSQAQGIEDHSISEEFSQMILSTGWFSIADNGSNPVKNLKLSNPSTKVKLKLVNEEGQPLEKTQARLLEWVDTNDNNKIDPLEIKLSKSTSSDALGIVAFNAADAHFHDTKFALQTSLPKNHIYPDIVIDGSVTSFEGLEKHFKELESFDTEIVYPISSSIITGQVFADFNSSFTKNELEHPIANVEIALINTVTDEKIKAHTNEQGIYSFENLKAGSYVLNIVGGPYGYESWEVANNEIKLGLSTLVEISPIGLSSQSYLAENVYMNKSHVAPSNTNIENIVPAIFAGEFNDVRLLPNEKDSYELALATFLSVLVMFKVALLIYRKKYIQKI